MALSWQVEVDANFEKMFGIPSFGPNLKWIDIGRADQIEDTRRLTDAVGASGSQAGRVRIWDLSSSPKPMKDIKLDAALYYSLTSVTDGSLAVTPRAICSRLLQDLKTKYVYELLVGGELEFSLTNPTVADGKRDWEPCFDWGRIFSTLGAANHEGDEISPEELQASAAAFRSADLDSLLAWYIERFGNLHFQVEEGKKQHFTYPAKRR